MNFPFYKYQGTGNDFVIIDNRTLFFPKNNTRLIAQLCDRRFGVGADGLILLEQHEKADFKMVYFNADGNESTMCGNGGRCLVHFAHQLQLFKNETSFEAIDGMHEASISGSIVSLKMMDVTEIREEETHSFLDTGSPHHVELVENVDDWNVFAQGRHIRNKVYGKEGANVNFVTPKGGDIFKVRTYERGVEDETLSCGTGVTAVALAMHKSKRTNATTVGINTPGGDLKVSFESTENGYKNIYLTGPAALVFKGEWS